ncbi:uncharacterized protein A1O9_08962 [Exophiala aquamarina CBS 119918]|uniref:Uncharacterized protein n=1 Tax=Exophiala aquamarina CBS 119918 TaxID=1182545 RepID=A0A072P7S0_9EURO|nr:uncharacterized protein A1O9_08962 [Exophiala aquamarina CBS 119918]KEF55308.1 hypothetical protein A1O9_08962 [Exophiala aquamarina CBS 119918]
MCKAHVLRFCCGHGILMRMELCKVGPCPMLKTTGVKLPQQPYKCYNCQNRLSSSSLRPVSSRGGSCSSTGSLDSNGSAGSATTPPSPISPISRVDSKAMAPLPGVVRQPAECGELARTFSRTQSASQKAFTFACSSSSHFLTPHYMNLPSYLPHQDHSCPPCQMEEYREKSDRDAIASAKAQFPHLTTEMLVRNGRVWEDWQTKPTLEKFIEEKRIEEKQMWLHVTRKWTQDLKKGRVLVSEEDGLGLMG